MVAHNSDFASAIFQSLNVAEKNRQSNDCLPFMFFLSNDLFELISVENKVKSHRVDNQCFCLFDQNIRKFIKWNLGNTKSLAFGKFLKFQYIRKYRLKDFALFILKNKDGYYCFHAGTKFKDGEIVTNGGRVLGITATGKDLKEARKNA